MFIETEKERKKKEEKDGVQMKGRKRIGINESRKPEKMNLATL